MRPQAIRQYKDVDLKLAIKSSFPHAKPTLALLIMLWEVSDRPSEINYSKLANGKLVIADELETKLIKTYRALYVDRGISDSAFVEIVNNNELFKQQLEPLLVGIELVWRIARIKFVDGMAQGSERTGGERFPKVLEYTSNVDIIDVLVNTGSDHAEYANVLLKWVGCNVAAKLEYENTLIRLLTCLAENSIYRLEENGKDVIFNPSSLYATLLESSDSTVDINGDAETKGSLRVLKSALSEGLNSYLSYVRGGVVKISLVGSDVLKAYQSRVDNYLSINIGTLRSLKHIIFVEGSDQGDATEVNDESPPYSRATNESSKKMVGANHLLYGLPGSGKSHTVKTEYCNDESRMERIVFHPDYTYSDFVGQIMPTLDDSKSIHYEFTPGPFTRILKKAYDDPAQEYFLVIEELNRGNAPAIFGEVFQLLDRNEQAQDGAVGESSYGITNVYVAAYVYGNTERLVQIPSNLSIVATMNTSDQNVFTLDTAFQRRWRMRMVENNVDDAVHANDVILDTTVTWAHFNKEINKLILEANAHLSSMEDKRLGAYFVTQADLKKPDSANSEDADEWVSRFSEKVLKYLWDDAFKFSRDAVFKIDDYRSLEAIIIAFKANTGNARFNNVFKDGVLGDIGD